MSAESIGFSESLMRDFSIKSVLEDSRDPEKLGNLANAKDTLRVKTRGFAVKGKINAGVTSTIYLVCLQHGKKEKLMACKVINKKTANPLFVEKFLPREVKMLCHLSHPHCIQVHRLIETESKCYFFMRYAEHGDLHEFLRQTGSLPEAHARLWSRQIGLAVRYLHSLNIAHRDIKCENILITSKLNAKLADFGFCRCWVNRFGKEEKSDTYCGSLHYASPEVLQGTPYRPYPSDIWSLGVVIFVMINGRTPFTGKKIKAVLKQQVEGDYHFHPAVKDTLSNSLKRLIESIFRPAKDRATLDSILNSEWMREDPKLFIIVPDDPKR